MNSQHWMRLAYQLALAAEAKGEVPVGAVLVNANNQCIAFAHNDVVRANDPCGHAEILAIREGARQTGNHRLNGCTLYVTLEPCAMCAGAIVQARIQRIVFATRDFKAGAAGSVYNLLQGYPLNHRVTIDEGVMEKECTLLLRQFFERLR